MRRSVLKPCFYLPLYKIKFMFSKKATKFDKIFTIDLVLCILVVSVKSTGKISSIIVAFLENMDFKKELLKVAKSWKKLLQFSLPNNWCVFCHCALTGSLFLKNIWLVLLYSSFFLRRASWFCQTAVKKLRFSTLWFKYQLLFMEK